jgi:proteasome lid subunit RPN8/RPN11
MRRAPVLLETAAAQAMARAVEEAGTDEMVGLVAGHATADVLHVVRFAPLGSAVCESDRFTVAPWHFAAAEQDLRAAGLQWLGFAHSHPGGEPVPSAADREQLWPHCLQLVLGTARGALAIGAFFCDAEGFHELPVRREVDR